MIHRLWFSVGLPLFSFVFYWADVGRRNLGSGDNPYSGTATDLMWDAIVTIVLIVALWLYFPVSEKIERFSPAWIFGITCGIGFFFIGLTMQNIGGILGGPMRGSFFSWITVEFIGMPKDRTNEQNYEWSFFKRARPIDE